jgi:hypothetical protein
MGTPSAAAGVALALTLQARRSSDCLNPSKLSILKGFEVLSDCCVTARLTPKKWKNGRNMNGTEESLIVSFINLITAIQKTNLRDDILPTNQDRGRTARWSPEKWPAISQELHRIQPL